MADGCKICGGATEHVDFVPGRLDDHRFELRRCLSCAYAYIADPRLDFERIYDEAYYRGEGVDPSVNYDDELDNPRSVRRHEWRGIVRWVSSVTPLSAKHRWLDYGCGAGGLLGFLREQGVCEAVGYDQGHVTPRLAGRGLDVVSDADLGGLRGAFDVVTAIEVLEHLVDPLAELAKIRALLRPGGLLFLTTGNAEPHRDHLTKWGYLVPEIHVSLFEPRTLAVALERTGFAPISTGYAPGWDDIIRFKVLKTLRVRSTNVIERMVPWRVVSRVVDWRLRPSAQPIGRAL
jgi:SAM-dependent methyltransferase